MLSGAVCGCAARPGTSPRVLPVMHPPATAVPYSEVRPDDLIPDEYRVRPGDVLELSISDLVGPGVETTRVLRVKESGAMVLPLIGDLPVAGLTEAEVNDVVRQALRVLCW